MREWFGDDMTSCELKWLPRRDRGIAEVMDEVLDSLDKDENILLRKIVDRWNELFAHEICSHSAPRMIRGKKLYIEVVDPSWMFHMENNLKLEIQTIIQQVTNNKVNSIRFVPGGRTRRPYGQR